MEKPDITTREAPTFTVWYDTQDPQFVDICFKSGIPEFWMNFNRVRSGEYKDSILKPINRYVEALVPPPQLVSIDGNMVRLRQGNHAEMFLLIHEHEGFINRDRPWMRQYYNTKLDLKAKDCFDGTYKFYVPWVLDENIDVFVEPSPVETPFNSYPVKHRFAKINPAVRYVEPPFVPFNFRSVGSHMVSENFGKIPRQSAMFDIVFYASDIIVERVKEFYDKYNTVLPTK